MDRREKLAAPPDRRSSMSLEIDRRAFVLDDIRPYSYSTSPEESTTPTTRSYFDLAAIPRSTSNGDDIDPQRSQRSRVPEHRLTVGPDVTEKVWSIGAGEGSEEDGQVEKSVAEAMAGVEPNARSRKSSYRLRFFKEGLPPEDKSRRKDTKQATRDKVPSSIEENAIVDPEPVAREDIDGYLAEARTDGGVIKTPPASHHEVKAGDKTPVDYFTIEGRGDAGAANFVAVEIKPRATEGERRPGSSHSRGVKTPTIDTKSPQKTRDVPLGGETGESQDSGDADADESGEEKISSAVFLPHQELPDARVNEVEPPSPDSHPQRPRSISQNQPHPWLVKADELETDVELKEEEEEERQPAMRKLASKESLRARREDDDVEHNAAHERPRDDPPEVKPFVAPKVQRAVTQYDDHVHDHRHHPREPLEAIELIPYKHQVGGHTTLWRFSRRAVCKQLNNRENEFYETIERYHRDLLPFLPR